MQLLEVRGGKPLRGHVQIGGAKNEVTKLMVASTLLSKPLTLHNVPAIEDVEITADLLRRIGVEVQYQPDAHTLTLDARHITKSEAIYGPGRGNRLSILLAGPLLHRFGQATVEKPQGCRIGERPLDLHLYYLQQLGVTVEEDDLLIHLKGKPTAGQIEFPYKSVGATEGALLAAVHAEGETIIKNHAHEPEIVELITVLQQAGAIIEYDAEGVLHVTGVDQPLAIDHPIRIIGDRIEAVSYIAAALATDGEVTLEGIDQRHIITALSAFRRVGAQIDFEGDLIRVKRAKGALHPLQLETDPHPAFATDFQQVFVVLLSQAEGTSHMHETVFDNRFAYLEQLNKLGGHFEVSPECLPFKPCRFAGEHTHMATINGPMHFHGGTAEITDLRAAFALVIAGLLADQPTHLHHAHHLLRGYDKAIEKLRALGADIKLVSE